MSTEVKIDYGEVENQLREMNSKTESLIPRAEPPITGNTMDVVTKQTKLSIQLEQLLMNYQTVLMENSKTTTSSVEFMRESDEKIATVMHSTLSGPKQAML
jgi:hypothetical protein